MNSDELEFAIELRKINPRLWIIKSPSIVDENKNDSYDLSEYGKRGSKNIVHILNRTKQEIIDYVRTHN